MRLFAPAKINLSLHILDRLPNGYHNLASVFERISLCDEIELTLLRHPEPGGRRIQLECTGFFAGAQNDIPAEQNLAFKAAKLLQTEAKISDGVRIKLTKKIPMGAGLGGGSSDAAAVLLGLNELWGLQWSVERLADLGVQLGADIPFFLYKNPCFVEGIGEKVMKLENFPQFWAILLYPGVAVATPWAYQALDQFRERNRLTLPFQDVSLPRPAGIDNFRELLKILHNDFEAVIFNQYPQIRSAKESLLKIGASGALMSGSGSTVFGLFESVEERSRALKKLVTKPSWQVFLVENGMGK